MKLRMLAIPLILIVSVGLSGCSSNQVANQSAYTPYHLADLLKYKGSYVGNNSAVGSILSMLPGHDYMASFSLETEQKPYGIAVNYQPKQSVSSNYSDFCNNKRPDELLERNAAVLFSLVQNVDVVNFNAPDVGKKTYTFTRTDVQQKYGDLSRILHNQASFTNFLNT
ncbi:DUF4825 domain-containing protein [Alicyclobacillus fastidiosus]|uniref:DUF4825 domain-containing protein n=1 Tax=Alicyclobacillus fastidiosus TaxID=392011 RepID=A0ABV5ALU4_9BACL